MQQYHHFLFTTFCYIGPFHKHSNIPLSIVRVVEALFFNIVIFPITFSFFFFINTAIFPLKNTGILQYGPRIKFILSGTVSIPAPNMKHCQVDVQKEYFWTHGPFWLFFDGTFCLFFSRSCAENWNLTKFDILTSSNSNMTGQIHLMNDHLKKHFFFFLFSFILLTPTLKSIGHTFSLTSKRNYFISGIYTLLDQEVIQQGSGGY